VRRREFITLLGTAAVIQPLAVGAQQAGSTYKLGVLSGNSRDQPQFGAFFDELRQLGFVEGRNLTVDSRGFARRLEEFPEIAIDLVKSGVDAILCSSGVPAIRAAQGATRTIPIFGLADDMVASGLVNSLARPGGNTTGISILAPELDGKRQDILIELVPDARRIAALVDPLITGPREIQVLQDAMRARGIALSIHPVGKPEDIVPAISAAQTSGAAALNVLATSLFSINRQIIIEHAAAVRLPAIYQWPEMAEQGGLAAYGPRLDQLYRQVAHQVAKVLRGANLTDLPVEQPTKFDLVINLKTAKVIGLKPPTPILVRADEVIE
jgi:putative ABC transport system substrate-binding protein